MRKGSMSAEHPLRRRYCISALALTCCFATCSPRRSGDAAETNESRRLASSGGLPAVTPVATPQIPADAPPSPSDQSVVTANDSNPEGRIREWVRRGAILLRLESLTPIGSEGRVEGEFSLRNESSAPLVVSKIEIEFLSDLPPGQEPWISIWNGPLRPQFDMIADATPPRLQVTTTGSWEIKTGPPYTFPLSGNFGSTEGRALRVRVRYEDRLIAGPFTIRLGEFPASDGPPLIAVGRNDATYQEILGARNNHVQEVPIERPLRSLVYRVTSLNAGGIGDLEALIPENFKGDLHAGDGGSGTNDERLAVGVSNVIAIAEREEITYVLSNLTREPVRIRSVEHVVYGQGPFSLSAGRLQFMNVSARDSNEMVISPGDPLEVVASVAGQNHPGQLCVRVVYSDQKASIFVLLRLGSAARR